LKERFRYEVFEGPHPFDPLEDLAKVDMVHDAIFEDAFKKLARAVKDTYARFREHRSRRASTVEEIG
jgi:hypothetical protein